MDDSSAVPSPSSDPRITPAMEDYLKAIYRLQEDGAPVTNQALADTLGYSGASITNMQKRLHDLKLLVLEPYKGVRLTPAGTAVALEVIRHHRLLELYLAQTLGMDLDAVHDEADRLEHHVSEELERLIAAALGYPEFDPHGDPIPSPELRMTEMDDMSLRAAHGARSAVVTRVSDRDADVVRSLVACGVVPGADLMGIDIAADQHSGILVRANGDSIAINEQQIDAIRVRVVD